MEKLHTLTLTLSYTLLVTRQQPLVTLHNHQHNIMIALGVFISIQHLGLFTNIA